jgi:hypothetical protein
MRGNLEQASGLDDGQHRSIVAHAYSILLSFGNFSTEVLYGH